MTRNIADERWEEFVFTAVHDLRAPLRAIELLVSWAVEEIGREAGPIPKQAQADLDEVTSYCEKLANLLHDLLVLAAKPPLESEKTFIDPNPLIRLAFSEFGAEHCDLVVPKDLPDLAVSAGELAIVVRCIASNSLKFRRGSKACVNVHWRRSPKIVKITFSDIGIGLNGACGKEIFCEFKRFTELPGNGLGLALVKRIVQRWGGQVLARDNEPEHGLSIVLHLPESLASTPI